MAISVGPDPRSEAQQRRQVAPVVATMSSSPSQPASWRSSAESSSAVSGGAPGSAYAAFTWRTPALRSALRSTRAAIVSPSRNGST